MKNPTMNKLYTFFTYSNILPVVNIINITLSNHKNIYCNTTMILKLMYIITWPRRRYDLFGHVANCKWCSALFLGSILAQIIKLAYTINSWSDFKCNLCPWFRIFINLCDIDTSLRITRGVLWKKYVFGILKCNLQTKINLYVI